MNESVEGRNMTNESQNAMTNREDGLDREMDSTLHALASATPPVGLRQRLHARIAREMEPASIAAPRARVAARGARVESKKIWWVAGAVSTAACAVAAIVLVPAMHSPMASSHGAAAPSAVVQPVAASTPANAEGQKVPGAVLAHASAGRAINQNAALAGVRQKTTDQFVADSTHLSPQERLLVKMAHRTPQQQQTDAALTTKPGAGVTAGAAAPGSATPGTDQDAPTADPATPEN
jgi:hypothetical protein